MQHQRLPQEVPAARESGEDLVVEVVAVVEHDEGRVLYLSLIIQGHNAYRGGSLQGGVLHEGFSGGVDLHPVVAARDVR